MPIASVVVPAHNEGTVIDRCLSSLLATAEPGEFEVVVACNACTDDTATRAARHPGVTVIELPEPSKQAALSAADATVATFPRIYLDADIALRTDAARRLAAALTEPGTEAAAPRVEFETTGRPWTIRRYFALRQRLPVATDAYVGSGVFALSRDGRSRFSTWPQHLPDDAFVQRLVPQDRRRTLDDSFLAPTPHTLRSQVRRSIRVRRLNRALEGGTTPGVAAATTGGTARFLLRELRRPAAWPDVAVFLLVTVLARGGARLADLRGGDVDWSRDETTR